MSKTISKTKTKAVAKATPAALLGDIRELIAQSREIVSTTVNATLTMLYWKIGDRIRREVLQEKRAEYGEEIVHALSAQLQAEYGSGFNEKSLRRMIQFADAFPDEEIVAALRRQLGWTHFKSIIPLKDPLQRDFYAEMCRIERWSTRTLEKKIQSMLYERTAISKKPDQLIRQELKGLRDEDRVTPDLVFRDPYILDFLGLKDTYSEKDLESAILRDMESFLIELGGDFAFVARQLRFTLDGDDFYIDLVFYHRRLRRLVAVDLKIGKFTPADMGQMEFYLCWLDKHERREGEGPPLGLILCADAKADRVELVEVAARGIHVAEYLTGLPPRELLQRKLHEVVLAARRRIENRAAEPGDEPKIGKRKKFGKAKKTK